MQTMMNGSTALALEKQGMKATPPAGIPERRRVSGGSLEGCPEVAYEPPADQPKKD